MHQLAEWEIGKQHADEEEVCEEDKPYPFRKRGVEADEAHSQFFYSHQIHLVEVAHEDARRGNGHDQEQREIVGREIDVAQLRYEDPSKKQIGHTR